MKTLTLFLAFFVVGALCDGLHGVRGGRQGRRGRQGRNQNQFFRQGRQEALPSYDNSGEQAPLSAYGSDLADPGFGGSNIAPGGLEAGAGNGGIGSGAEGEDDLAMLEKSVPGVPGQDYPIFAEVPESTFSCEGQVDGGYYADPEAQCQVFHICTANGHGGLAKYSFLCPNGTIFNQNYFICDWWFNFDCSEAQGLYSLNEQISAEREEATANAAANAASSGNGKGKPQPPPAPASSSQAFADNFAPQSDEGQSAAPVGLYGAPSAFSGGNGNDVSAADQPIYVPEQRQERRLRGRQERRQQRPRNGSRFVG